MSLREITHDLHQDAERTVFAKKLVEGSLTAQEYANYLWQMVPVYSAIEFGNRMMGNLETLKGIERTGAIYEDFLELAGRDHQFVWLPSTLEYYQYLTNLINDPNRRHLIKAHMYCRHMGDLFGGQIIAKKVQGQGRFYQFENPKELKEAIRATLTDDLGPEARVAFEFAIKMMRDLNYESSLENTD
jgi:heme oxygenase